MKRIIPILLALTLVFLLAACGAGSSSPEDIVSKYEKLINSSSPSKDDYADLYYRYNFLKNSSQKEKELESLDPKAYINDDMKSLYGDDVSITLNMIGEETYTTDKFSSTISSLSSEYETDKIEEIKTIKIEYKISGNKKSSSDTANAVIFKVSGKWYVYSISL